MTDSTPTPKYMRTLRSIPKSTFLFGPSPIQYLPNLTSLLSPSPSSPKVQIYTKREDCNSGLAHGGNKIRKLEYLLPLALAQNCTHLISVGGIQSNHTRAVTAVARVSRLKSVTVQEKWVPVDLPLYDRTGNILLSRLMGGEVRLNEEGFGIGHKESVKREMERIEKEGGKGFYIPAGASDHHFGGLGFVDFVVELAQQEEEMGIYFDTLVVCSVTGSSHAGLVVGAVAEGKGRKVIGIDASGRPEETREQVLRIARNTARLLDEELVVRDEDVVLDERFHEGVYGIPGKGTIEAMKCVARSDALITDPVYEGKSMAGLIQLVKEGSVKEGSNVLFVHLGGQPALNAYSSYFEEEGGEEKLDLKEEAARG